MKITDIRTTYIFIPHLGAIKDATIRHPTPGRGQCFVHIFTDEGLEGLGLGVGGRASQVLIDESLKPILIGQDPLTIEKLWDDMFWRVRGEGRKGLAFGAISALDTALWDLKAKYFNVPLYKLLGAYTDTSPYLWQRGLDPLQRGRTGRRADRLCRARHEVGQDEGGQGFRQKRKRGY